MAEGFSKVLRDRKSTMARTRVIVGCGVFCSFLSWYISSMWLVLSDGGEP